MINETNMLLCHVQQVLRFIPLQMALLQAYPQEMTLQ